MGKKSCAHRMLSAEETADVVFASKKMEDIHLRMMKGARRATPKQISDFLKAEKAFNRALGRFVRASR